MKKVLLAFDGDNFSEGAFEFASSLNKKEKILLTGVFISQVDTKNLWAYSIAVPPTVVPVLEEDVAVEEENMERFRNLCELNDISFKVHEDYLGFAIPELKRETKFADVLLIGSETFYRNLGRGINEYMMNTLQKAECPVVLIPECFVFPQSNVLAYDGSESSIYAIKQFAYLFPELCDNPTLLVYCEERGEIIPEKENMYELAAQHFSNLQILKLDIDPKRSFKKWLEEKNNSILVSGAFGRSALSQVFRKSFVADVVKEHQLPVFIAHK
jgi:nucleotide-binding universal stress UspA family protein